MPPKWLLVVSGICYAVYYAFFGGAIIGEDPSETANPSGLDEVVDFVKKFQALFFFDLAGEFIELNLFVRVFLFMFCTGPWILVFLEWIIAATQAIGSFIGGILP